MDHDYSELENETRKIYEAQHSKYLKDKVMYNRFLRMAQDLNYYGLQPTDIQGKEILDAGSGNSGYFQEAMYKHGASKIYSMDIGLSWIPILKEHLNTRLKLDGKESDKFLFSPGSTTKIPFPDGHFDVVFSNGVLMHLGSVQEAELAMSEMARVTKCGGKLFVYSGFDSGVIDNYLVPALRDAYKNCIDFKNYIDDLGGKSLQSEFTDILKMLRRKGDLSILVYLYLKKQNKKIFDEDLSRFFQNMLQVPNQQGNSLDSNWLRNQFEILNFSEVKFTKTYIHRKNIRKFLAPLHYSTTSHLGKILYGGGHVRAVATKQESQVI